MTYACCDPLRISAVAGSAVNGIAYLEVLDRAAPTPALRQRILHVHFVNDPAPALGPANVRISGGARVRDIDVINTAVDPTDGHILVVTVDQPGDFSIYTLDLVQGATNARPPGGIDPVLSSVDFSFKAECPTVFDCKPGFACLPTVDLVPEIDYLAKDYASFRRLMLDRIAVLAPHWKERNPSDLGIALVELFAFVGDYLSYQQDAIATEAYLRTARRRVSVRRHAVLVDYAMHDGCNARAWVHLEVNSNVTTPLPKGTPLCTVLLDRATLLPNPESLTKADAIFETMADVEALYVAHNELRFYTWSDQECCLPARATRATLQGHLRDLKASDCDADEPQSGDVLIFEEVLGPLSGESADADPNHRWAVRLTAVNAFDSANNPLTDPVTGAEITEIVWADEDALPFPLCVSSRTDSEHGERYVEDVSVARGNTVLVDHGFTLDPEDLASVPEPRVFLPETGGACAREDLVAVPPRYQPTLKQGPLTQVAPVSCGIAASRAIVSKPSEALPAIWLDALLDGDPSEWQPKHDLLNSEGTDLLFVAEIEADGIASLRFGDNRHGLRPKSGTAFSATYRVGNGVQGNVGREAIHHILSADSAIVGVRNPMPARGGIDQESMEDVRQRAPSAFRTQERAVTELDYAEVTQRVPDIQRAAATFRWTGSWHTVFLTVDRFAGAMVDADVEQDVLAYVERFRMAGYDLEVDAPIPVSLRIEMLVCAKPDYFRGDVKAALLEVFSNRELPGRRGVFHPDNFTFGQTVYLSRLYAAAQDVPGVDSVEITSFGRMGVTDPKPLQDGQLLLNRLEIARLDNDPNFPEHGVFTLRVVGGK